MTPGEFARLLRTVRYLKPSQLAWRLRYRLAGSSPSSYRRDEAPQPAAEFPAIPALHADRSGEAIAQQLKAGSLTLLHQAFNLKDGALDWHLGPQSNGRLATVTLHYHEWLYLLAEEAAGEGTSAQEAGALLAQHLGDWIARCGSQGQGVRELAWNAYAIATRLGWWTRLWHKLGTKSRANWGELEGAFLRSLAEQASFLHDHIEWDLRGNHLLRDAVGLAYAGRFFEGTEAERWLAKATDLAVRQAREQVRPDGGHFERSAMYHLHAMEDLLQLTALLKDDDARRELRETWGRMAVVAAWLRHPDGQIPLLNDAALNGSAHPQALLDAGAALLNTAVVTPSRRVGKFFKDSGLAVWHGDHWSFFFETGAVGPDYQPGHAHADTLTLETSFHGQRLFVDPGTYAYDLDERRRYDRSTAAHNTVCIDGEDSSEVWHIFRVGRRARVRCVVSSPEARGMTVTSEHDGYVHLPGRPRHGRTVSVDGMGVLEVEDQISGEGRHRLEGGWLLAPGWSAEEAPGGWKVEKNGLRLRIMVSGPAGLSCRIAKAAYHPEFGLEEQTTRLLWQIESEIPLGVRLTAQAV